ncbi:major facilitator superfamily domain-containing protein [Apiospora marii]|uniref:Major facilitator superfamily domain-containing protein n=1 Tax=Apiospora marii TaxID=335849 RepID=A0ABR1SAJ3_9PEZI
MTSSTSALTIELAPMSDRGLVSSSTGKAGIPSMPPNAATGHPDAARVSATQSVAAGDIPTKTSKVRGITVIATLAGISFLNTMGSGILVSAIPQIARDLDLQRGLELWPAAVYALAAGCLLLIFGALADSVVGAKPMWVAGSYLFCAFTVALGFARTGGQLIALRTLLGASIAMCLPTAVGLITLTFPHKGTWRNVAFAMNGMGQPLGFALGLVLGGVFTDTIGWRWAYFMMAGINFVLSTASIWSLPHKPVRTGQTLMARLVEIDWVGAIMLSAALGLLMYVLAMTTSSYLSIGYAQNAALLAVSLALLIAFPFWMHWQTLKGRPALIPNRLWRNATFTSVCINVFFGWAALNGLEYFTTLYFQEIEGLSALQSSLRFIPHPILGALTNIATAYLISRVEVRTLTTFSAVITVIPPILMATINVGENYWFAPFWALLLSPMNPDGKFIFPGLLFTASNLVISEAFPPELQSLAGGVFNEVAQFGNSVGLAVTAAIAASVTDHSRSADSKAALMEGYRAAFWTIFAATGLVVFVSYFGFRKGGTVGKKNE